MLGEDAGRPWITTTRGLPSCHVLPLTRPRSGLRCGFRVKGCRLPPAGQKEVKAVGWRPLGPASGVVCGASPRPQHAACRVTRGGQASRDHFVQVLWAGQCPQHSVCPVTHSPGEEAQFPGGAGGPHGTQPPSGRDTAEAGCGAVVLSLGCTAKLGRPPGGASGPSGRVLWLH